MAIHRKNRLTSARGAVLAGLLGLSLACASRASADPRSGLRDFETGHFSEAFEAWQDAAEHGDGAAALYLGVLYDIGIGVPQDQRRALTWYERGAEAGNVTAMFNAGVMHDAGRGAASDPAAAAVWYRRAAERDYARAEYNLGLLYVSGSGVAPNRKSAIRLFRAAAGHGVTAARSHLRALGVPTEAATSPPVRDPAMDQFKQAQDVLLQRGVGEAGDAVKFFRAAAENGNALAAYNLAYYYQHGIGVAPNLDEALKWYQRAEELATDETTKELARSGMSSLLASVSHAQR